MSRWLSSLLLKANILLNSMKKTMVLKRTWKHQELLKGPKVPTNWPGEKTHCFILISDVSWRKYFWKRVKKYFAKMILTMHLPIPSLQRQTIISIIVGLCPLNVKRDKICMISISYIFQSTCLTLLGRKAFQAYFCVYFHFGM